MSARLLLVDDNRMNLAVLEARLSRDYYELIQAQDGPAALQLAQTESPDLILLDVMMPGMDGFEVCRRLKAGLHTAHIPIVMVTALSERSDRVQGLNAGADDFLTKPVNDLSLMARVRSLVRLKQMMDEWRMRAQTSAQLGVDPTAAEEGKAAQVLVVDGPEGRRTKAELERHGHAVTLFSSVKEGAASALAGDFDVALIGLHLGEEDGLRLCSMLRSDRRTRTLPILLMIDEHEIEPMAKGLDLGVTDYIIRPVDPNELLARVRTQVRRKRYQNRLREDFDRSLSMAFTDSLTGLYNRRYLTAHLGTLMEESERDGRPLSLLVVDIDNFKRVNDTYGHQAGDAVLREVATRLSRNLRNFDLVARFGGEEFVAVLPNADAAGCMVVAERVRESVAAQPIEQGLPVPISITVSIGAAVGRRTREQPDALIERADKALYDAKETGRNKTVLASPMEADGTASSQAAGSA
jgi:two-component system, cell cycle response regulator